MKPYVLSLGAGLMVGIIYSLLDVRSPAPPMIALVGLLGILIGEQAIPFAKRLFGPEPVTASWVSQQSGDHGPGRLSGRAHECTESTTTNSGDSP